jgi:hypothetical protein
MGYAQATLTEHRAGESYLVHLVRHGETRTLCGVTVLILAIHDDSLEPTEYQDQRDSGWVCRDCRAKVTST